MIRGVSSVLAKVEKEDTDDMPTISFFRSAEAFLIAADKQREWLKENETIWALFDAMPIYFLYGHAIELMLKGFLRTQGFASRQLARDYGHDLLELLRESRRRNLIMDRDCMDMLGLLTQHFSEARWHITFKYISKSNELPFPTFDAVSAFSRALLESIRAVCGGAWKGLDEMERILQAIQNGELPPGETFSF